MTEMMGLMIEVTVSPIGSLPPLGGALAPAWPLRPPVLPGAPACAVPPLVEGWPPLPPVCVELPVRAAIGCTPPAPAAPGLPPRPASWAELAPARGAPLPALAAVGLALPALPELPAPPVLLALTVVLADGAASFVGAGAWLTAGVSTGAWLPATCVAPTLPTVSGEQAPTSGAMHIHRAWKMIGRERRLFNDMSRLLLRSVRILLSDPGAIPE
jgi:hypothetical protein